MKNKRRETLNEPIYIFSILFNYFNFWINEKLVELAFEMIKFN